MRLGLVPLVTTALVGLLAVPANAIPYPCPEALDCERVEHGRNNYICQGDGFIGWTNRYGGDGLVWYTIAGGGGGSCPVDQPFGEKDTNCFMAMWAPGSDPVEKETTSRDGFCAVDADLPSDILHGTPIHLSLTIYSPTSSSVLPVLVDCDQVAGNSMEVSCTQIVP